MDKPLTRDDEFEKLVTALGNAIHDAAILFAVGSNTGAENRVEIITSRRAAVIAEYKRVCEERDALKRNATTQPH